MGAGVHLQLNLVRVDDLLTTVLADGGGLGRLDRQAVGLDRRTRAGLFGGLVLARNLRAGGVSRRRRRSRKGGGGLELRPTTRSTVPRGATRETYMRFTHSVFFADRHVGGRVDLFLLAVMSGWVEGRGNVTTKTEGKFNILQPRPRNG